MVAGPYCRAARHSADPALTGFSILAMDIALVSVVWTYLVVPTG